LAAVVPGPFELVGFVVTDPSLELPQARHAASAIIGNADRNLRAI